MELQTTLSQVKMPLYKETIRNISSGITVEPFFNLQILYSVACLAVLTTEKCLFTSQKRSRAPVVHQGVWLGGYRNPAKKKTMAAIILDWPWWCSWYRWTMQQNQDGWSYFTQFFSETKLKNCATWTNQCKKNHLWLAIFSHTGYTGPIHHNCSFLFHSEWTCHISSSDLVGFLPDRVIPVNPWNPLFDRGLESWLFIGIPFYGRTIQVSEIL